MRGAAIIFRKELKEMLRDRKTLIFMLALPLVLIPLLLNLTVDFLIRAHTEAATKTLRYALVDQVNLPELDRTLAEQEGFERVALASPGEISAAVTRGDIDFAVVVMPATMPTESQGAGPQHRVELYYDNASATSQAKVRATQVIETLGKELRKERLEVLGVAAIDQEKLLTPVSLIPIGTADLRAVLGERIGGMLPYIFIVFSFLGALYPAVDLGAGEKERGTLETLLLAPLPRWQIVVGKYLVVFMAGATSAVLSLLSLGGWVAFKGHQLVGDIGTIVRSVDTIDLVLVAVMLVPTAAIFAALLLSISVYAKSFKEAQSYAAPMQLLMILPAFLAMLPGVELSWRWALVPITNIALAIKELVKGTMDYTMMVAILGSSVAIAAGLLGFCTWWFRRESVLFRM